MLTVNNSISVNQVLIDHDGTASTDFDDKTKTSPQVLAVIGNDLFCIEILFHVHIFTISFENSAIASRVGKARRRRG